MKQKITFSISILLIQLVFCSTLFAAKNEIPEMANSNPIYKKLRNIKMVNKAISVSNFTMEKDSAILTFVKGAFYFTDKVENKHTGAIFIGDGHFKMKPTLSVEQNQLKLLTGTKDISENFSFMVIRFTDDTAEQILKTGIPSTDTNFAKACKILKKNKKIMRKGKEYLNPNMAAGILKNNLDLRLLIDITRPVKDGFFYAFFNGQEYGDMIFVYDPMGTFTVTNEEVLLVGVDKKNLGVWVSEHQKEKGLKGIQDAAPFKMIDVKHYDIDVTPHEKKMKVKVKARFKILVEGLRVIPFNMHPGLRVKRVTTEDGRDLNFIQEKKKEDSNFGIILPKGSKKGELHTITFEYGGEKAVYNAGGGNYTLAADARFTWYPTTIFGNRATYAITLRTPKKMGVICTGQMIDDKVEDDKRVTRWKSDTPIIVAGFNYGLYDSTTVKDKESNVTIKSFANTQTPDYLEQFRKNRRMVGLSFNPANIDTTKLMDKVRSEAQIAVNLYTKTFGPMVFNNIFITQQPYPSFGQAWPRLIFMPIFSYLSSTQLQQLGFGISRMKFNDSVCAHEVGHQWWAHTVGMKSYRSNWIIEGMSQLSASMFLQKVYGNKRFLKFWTNNRTRSLKKNRKRKSPSKIGSVTLSYRLDTCKTGPIGGSILYGKSAFIFHMLRMMMQNHKLGDKLFSNMMKDAVTTYYNKNMSTEDFKKLTEKHITPQMNLDKNGRMDWFFNQWVYGTQIPHYSIKYDVKPTNNGKYSLRCKITQSKVDANFKMLVPIYLKFGARTIRLGSVQMKGNTTSNEIKVNLPKQPDKVLINAYEDVLCTY